jgi:hypothetical protein
MAGLQLIWAIIFIIALIAFGSKDKEECGD